MALSRDGRQERKLKAYLLAKWRFKQRIETIDWMEDVYHPTIEASKSGKSVLGLPEGMAFDIVIEDENHHSPEAVTAEPQPNTDASTGDN